MTTSSANPTRLVSIDAYRGLVMILLAFNGFGILEASRNFPASEGWQTAGWMFEHVAWRGCSLWDMIQPSFMFLVGVSIPWSLAAQKAKNISTGQGWVRALWRSFLLVVLGIFLISNNKPSTDFSFVNVLTQIGLGYLVVYAVAQSSRPLAPFVAAAILAAYWLLFAFWPIGSQELAAQLNLPIDRQQLAGFGAHWNQHLNPAASFDRWFLNLFPRETPFVFNRGGYQTLNFIPSIATMLLGLAAGQTIREVPGAFPAAIRLVLGGVVIALLGWLLDITGVCPLVKRIWTPSWTLWSGGLCLSILGLFHFLTEALQKQILAWPLTIAGMNSIVLYVCYMLLRPWTAASWERHFGPNIFLMAGPAMAPILQACFVGFSFWLFVWWLQRQKVFIRL